MAAWAETRGALTVVVCEHHTMSDGYLPTPLILATALAARTTTLSITVAVVVLPLYDPIRLAEEMVVLDIISAGRVGYVAAVGYRPEEYEQFGVDFHRRGRLADELLPLLLQAKTGEPFDHDGRRIHVTPAPHTPGGPWVAWGGGSPAAADEPGATGSTSSPSPATRRWVTPTPRKPGPTATSRACACSRPRARPPPCSWPTTSIGPGTSSGPT